MKRVLQSLLSNFGYRIVRDRGSFDFDFLSPEDMKQPGVILDVGAHLGTTTEVFLQQFPNMSVHCFEPYPQFSSHLRTAFQKQKQVSVHEYALSDTDGQGALITNDLNLSLISRSGECHAADGSDAGLETIDVPLRRLDDFVSDENIDNIFLLKIDTEGNDLNVLKGGEELLKRGGVDIIVCEYFFESIFEGGARYWEISQYLELFGYGMFDIRDIKRRGDQKLRYGNAIFIGPRILKKIS